MSMVEKVSSRSGLGAHPRSSAKEPSKGEVRIERVHKSRNVESLPILKQAVSTTLFVKCPKEASHPFRFTGASEIV